MVSHATITRGGSTRRCASSESRSSAAAIESRLRASPSESASSVAASESATRTAASESARRAAASGSSTSTSGGSTAWGSSSCSRVSASSRPRVSASCSRASSSTSVSGNGATIRTPVTISPGTVGSRLSSNSNRSVIESTRFTLARRGGVVSGSISESTLTVVSAPSSTSASSPGTKAACGSVDPASRSRLRSCQERTSKGPLGTNRREKTPSASVTFQWTIVSSSSTKRACTTAERTTSPVTRSSTIPATTLGTIAPPVESTRSKASRRLLPNMSLTTGRIVMRYTRSGRRSSPSEIRIPSRRCRTRTPSTAGETTTASSSVPPAARSLIRSLKRMKISRTPGSTTAKVSGRVSITYGGKRSSGPPGGISNWAQAERRSARGSIRAAMRVGRGGGDPQAGRSAPPTINPPAPAARPPSPAASRTALRTTPASRARGRPPPPARGSRSSRWPASPADPGDALPAARARG